VDRPFGRRSAVVTGAGRGTGRAIALSLVTGRSHVALLERSKDQLDEVAARLQQLGGTSLIVPTDVGNRAAVTDVVSQALGAFGSFDVLVNDAGVVWPLGTTTKISTFHPSGRRSE
jgi:NADP-dependent 3-hydroxy acid dehydrogenase YdfG